MEKYYAHSLEGVDDKALWQPLENHLRQTAVLAQSFAAAWKAGQWGYLAGLWHDIGKYSAEFQTVISSAGDGQVYSVVDHSTAGAQHAAKTLGHAGKILAYLIAGHHGGLPDGFSTDSCLRSRLEKDIPSWDDCPQGLMESCSLPLPFDLIPERAGIQLGMFIRMLYSCLVDADFLDTEAFLDSQKGIRRQGFKTLKELEVVFFSKLDCLRKSAASTHVNRQRNMILDQCLKASEREMGIFSLTVPTGGGKTLSSMAFAMRHAVKYGLKRIIYVIPFTSIIEQNASVFRSMLGEDQVLEHHCNYESESEDSRSRLATENWDAPIIVTTNVQFFESLFANRSSRCRKLHNISKSVIILDEVQTLPSQFLLPCLETLRELEATYKASIVLCSATQPAIQKRSDFPIGLEGVTEIIDNPQELACSLRRTDVKVLSNIQDSALAARLTKNRQVLCIVNTRKHARRLYEAMEGAEGRFHLSALMCPAHRSEQLIEIHRRLKEGHPCRVISTQLIEAGVDIDFPVVYRALAGIDSIAQAAGRCNREGTHEKGKVFVFEPEAGIPAGYFRQAAQAAESVIRRYKDGLLSLDAIDDYFRFYYWTKGESLDEHNILASLRAGIKEGDFPFKTIAGTFRFIKDEMMPVIIPYDENARELIKAMDRQETPSIITRKLQRYTVSVYPNEYDRLISIGSIELKAGIFPVLVDETLYKSDIGLCVDATTTVNPDDLYI